MSMTLTNHFDRPVAVGDSITFIDHANKKFDLITGTVVRKTVLDVYLVMTLPGVIYTFAPECNLPASADYGLMTAAPVVGA